MPFYEIARAVTARINNKAVYSTDMIKKKAAIPKGWVGANRYGGGILAGETAHNLWGCPLRDKHTSEIYHAFGKAG